jgi:hypothetical protein
MSSPEPFRLLVRVGVTADVDQERRVVHARPGLLVQPDPLGEPEGDQTLAEHVLHRLPEAEVDAERERSDELGEPHPSSIRRVLHASEGTRGPGGLERGPSGVDVASSAS